MDQPIDLERQTHTYAMATHAPVQALLGVEDYELVDHLRHLREEEGPRQQQKAPVAIVVCICMCVEWIERCDGFDVSGVFFTSDIYTHNHIVHTAKAKMRTGMPS